ncbi:MAG: hypothetical protein KC417_09610, partial [Myxococcales bacterium]|nr:hypothetical protein [Myxococcales bacterium]
MAQKLLTLAVVLLSVPAFGACGDSITQVVIRVDTELRVPCEVEEIEIVVDPAVVDDSGRAPGRIDLRNLLGSNALPLQLPIQGSSGQSYSVTVRAYNDGAIVQELSGTIDTKADSSRVLAFNLDSGEVATQADLPKRVLHAPSVCEEVCNGKDDNENGRIDENLPDCDPCSMCPEGYECV